jgi:hypothetical protein
MDFAVDVAPSLGGHHYTLHLHAPGDVHFAEIPVDSSNGLHLSFHFAPPPGIVVGTWIAHLYVDDFDTGTSTTFRIGP